ncbi:tRNA preQ1(34) S-adenosylmethionine ribosyltransferase-isomerase QueA [Anaerosinus gibii]|uniref:S-adenosylmethionine:tRNA ribosyltransferase-isomerase n=1 Tax=Selenobaculum gibii TaxID=3054208 RepID=A0A9Y2AJ35_9FIRM|nr:tRNA preQ1(34) S-adenosylmethionine ribosyltransferase-isomerase QueA [Selenobaculum gbiensis]WIW71769.1 tRNA preQ1(34) S-adenosylmethionine ribosyltransferase-isomerase QueA [Selenobaculum gbiensis]
MLLSEFDYDLPESFIAQTPCEPRDHSKLLILDSQTGRIEHKIFYQLKEYLKPGDTIIFNDTKVIPARLIGTKDETGAKIEVFLLSRKTGDEWEALVKPGKKARVGAKINFGEELSCEIIENTDFGGRIVKFHYEGIFEEILDRLGETPLPPYIHEKLQDKERYQTVYAKERGSAAAPTAGLHFTKAMLTDLKEKGINLGFVTLHVGLGTFRPVNVEKIEEHQMHREYYSLPKETADLINLTKQRGNRVIAIGTTAIRTLESASEKKDFIEAKSGWTDIFIYPGYEFKIVDALVTNFHLPKSTLLMLISAFSGKENIFHAYEEAKKCKYRFFSFGDAMFLLNQKSK